MSQTHIHEVRAERAEGSAAAQRGEEVLICRRNRPVARLFAVPPATATALFCHPDNDVFRSAISVWGIVVKCSVGKLPLSDAPARYLPRERQHHGIDPLPPDEGAALRLRRLPAAHTDPFDRLLVCQAVHHGLTLPTPAPAIRRYPVPVQW